MHPKDAAGTANSVDPDQEQSGQKLRNIMVYLLIAKVPADRPAGR